MKLISALGENYDIIMEIVDFLNGDFAYSEGARKTKLLFVNPLDELILFCTTQTVSVFEDLWATLSPEYPDISLQRIDLNIPDITSAQDERKIREVVFKTVDQYQNEMLIVSSAGRKDITQRIVEAGYIYGFYGYLSITFSAEFSRIKKDTRGLRDYQIVRKHPECLIVNWYPLSTLLRRKYGLPETTQTDIQQSADETCKEPELIQNFSALYSLPLAIIHRLKTETIGTDRTSEQRDLAWLRALPKTDLHCHLGGAAGPQELKRIADAMLSDNLIYAQWKEKIQSIEKELRTRSLEEELERRKGTTPRHPLHYLKEYYKEIAPRVPVFIVNAVQLSALSIDEISRLMSYTPPLSYIGDESDAERLDRYIDAGNFGGSMLLQTKASLKAAMDCLLHAYLQDNVRYAEVRISPMNYCDGGLTPSEVMNTLLEASSLFIHDHPAIRVNFIIIATRHKDKASIDKNISTALEFSRPRSINTRQNDVSHGAFLSPHVCGVDLAGKESGYRPQQFIEQFQPLHHNFIKITIHAGETEGSPYIWEALYHLHARRIGHGLKLYEDKKMMDYLRDFHISLEMCPTSNAKICRYNDFGRGNDNTRNDDYPLKRYLDEGVGVTINTDNPGISQGGITEEYVKACHLTKGGLSKWDVLKIVRQGFVSSFLPLKQKNLLLKEAEQQILSFLIHDYLEPE